MRINGNLILFILTNLIICLFSSSALSADIQVGVYYYPGWSTGTDQPATVVSSWSPGWAPIKNYIDRKPLLGWYKEGDVNVMTQQLDWMKEYGIDFVAFDWYWSKIKNRPNKEHAVQAYLRSGSRTKVSFALLWANHSGAPESPQQLLDILKYWIDNYLLEPEYLHIDGKPVLFVFSADLFEKDVNAFGSDTKAQLQVMQDFAKNHGVATGLYFVAGTRSEDKFAGLLGAQSGYSAVSAYNYHAQPQGKLTTSYKELDAAYRTHWKQLIKRSPLAVILPLTVGWDKRPWGGSRNAKHDNSISSPEEFREHLLAAKSILTTDQSPPCNMAVLCCWNEFGEGAFVEPTESAQFSHLEQLQEVLEQN